MTTPIYYYDTSKVGKDYIGNKDILLLTNEQAILESVKNILGTEPGERVMYPTFGCPLSKYLFEPLDPITMISLKTTIENAITKFEDRITNLNVIVSVNEDLNSLDILVTFSVKTTSETQVLTVTLNQIR